MEFAEFARRAREVEGLSADTEIRDAVTDLLSAADDDLPVVARFVQGRVFPAWDSTTLDVGPSYCHEAIARAAGPNVSAGDVERRLADLGEIGEVAADYDLSGQRGLDAFAGGGDDGDDGDGDDDGEDGGGSDGSGDGGGPTVGEVYAEFERIAGAEGEGSQGAKIDALFGLLSGAEPVEARYVVRLVLSEMRIGVGEGTVRDAVAAAFDVPTAEVERALQVTNDYGRVAAVAREDGVEGLREVSLTVGRPVQAMLAQAGTVAEAIEEWGEAAVQPKFDGARVQVHHDGEAVWVFSRNMEEVTDALPEVVEFVRATLDAPAILDGEVVAVDDAGDPLPFQEVLRRFRRKYDVERAREDVSVEFHAFDCLHVGPAVDPGADPSHGKGIEVGDRADRTGGDDGDPTGHDGSPTGDDGGEDLLDAPLTERHRRLRSVLSSGVVDLHVTDDPDEVADLERTALAAGHEGIVLKNPDSAYTPGRRGKNWLKRKPDVETLDLAVTGAEWGEGRRANLLGTFEVSARADGGFAPVGKVATGITDEELAELTELLEPSIRAQEGREVAVEPDVVFEVGYEEIQTSPTYASGFALRFPRFVGVRHDLDPDDADSLERIADLADGG